MFWAIIGIIAVIAICSIASSSGDQAEAAQKKAENEQKLIAGAIQAKVPDVFRELFAEEFRDYGAELTYVRAESFLRKWGEAVASSQFSRHVSYWTGKFKDDDSMRLACEYILQHAAPAISQEFAEFAMKSPVEMYRRIQDVIKSTSVKAHGE